MFKDYKVTNKYCDIKVMESPSGFSIIAINNKLIKFEKDNKYCCLVDIYDILERPIDNIFDFNQLEADELKILLKAINFYNTYGALWFDYIPEYLVGYVFNGDCEGLTEQEIEDCDKFLSNKMFISIMGEETYFRDGCNCYAISFFQKEDIWC